MTGFLKLDKKMVDRIKDYIKEQLKTRFFSDIKGDLLNKGWPGREIDGAYNKILNPMSTGKLIFIIFACLFLFFLALGGIASAAYFYFIAPLNVQAPMLEKPEIQQPSPVQNEQDSEIISPVHLIYLLNEIGAYNLHNSPTGDAPRINFIISDLNKEYSFSVVNNRLINISQVSNPDIKIESNRAEIIEIYGSNNTRKTIMDCYNGGRIKVDAVADIASLTLKGYLSLYSYFGITGAVIMEESAVQGSACTTIVILMIVCVAYLIKGMRKTKKRSKLQKHKSSYP